MATYIYAEYTYGKEEPEINIVYDITELSGRKLDTALQCINEVYNHEGEEWWGNEWWDFDAYQLSTEDLMDFANANEFAFCENGALFHVEMEHVAEIEQDTIAGRLIAEAIARHGCDKFPAIETWLADQIGHDKLPNHDGHVTFPDGSMLNVSRKNGNILFSLPAAE